MNSKYLVLITVICLLLMLTVNTASARYSVGTQPNGGINIGDTIFIGERNLDFSEFNTPGKTLTSIVHEDGSRYGVITIIDNKSSLTGLEYQSGMYVARYADDSKDSKKYCIVRNLDLGNISLYTYNDDVAPTSPPPSPAVVGKTTLIAFVVPKANIAGANFTGNWYKYTLSRAGVSASYVNNYADNPVYYETLTADPSVPPEYNTTNPVFTLRDQLGISSAGTDDVPVNVMFTTNKLNDLVKTVSYDITASNFLPSITLSETRPKQNSNLIVTITGLPYHLYNLTISGSDTAVSPRFSEGEYTKINNQSISVYTEWSGKKSFTINIPNTAEPGSYKVTLNDSESSQYKTFTVVSGNLELVFDDPSEKNGDLFNGGYAIGDKISIGGTVNGATAPVPIYLFITGPNLPPNGGKLSNPFSSVVDGDPSSFTVTTYSIILEKWETEWDTNNGLETGTYTIYASLSPYGYLTSGKPGGIGSDLYGNVIPSWDIPISQPTLNYKFDDTNNGIFAQGTQLYGWWLSRGSTSELRWYIFGNNFLYADREEDMAASLKPNAESDDSGAPWNEYGFIYPRSFTYQLSPGKYYMICQHPGPDGNFSVGADRYGGKITYLTSRSGNYTDISSFQSTQAADALKTMLDDPMVDDIYVQAEILIEKPWIRIINQGDITVGDELKIEGTTNLLASSEGPGSVKIQDELSLKIYRMDMDTTGHSSNIAMMIPSSTTTPGSSLSYTRYRTFGFDDIDTSTWFPGSYLATVTCKDAGYDQTIAFDVVESESVSGAAVLNSDADTAYSAKAKQTSAAGKTVQSTPAASYTQSVQTQSSGNGGIWAVVFPIFAVLITFEYVRRK